MNFHVEIWRQRFRVVLVQQTNSEANCRQTDS